ncbi:EGLN1, partial [Symbiodinium pilosum]
QGYCVLDNFLTDGQARDLRNEVAECHKAGRLEAGGLVNGKLPSADDAKYADRATRGDVIGWFDSGQEEWPHGRALEGYLLKLGTLVSELQTTVPELAKITSRSKAMVACYPGGGARYIKHVDNDGKHALCKTRLLTALIYLNDGWEEGDGGELAIFRADDENALRRTVPPVANRVLLFWSDWRTPHEVRPSEKMRYSVTLWLLDNTKKSPEAEVAEPMASPTADQPPAARDPQPSLAEDTNRKESVQHEWSSQPEYWELKVQFPGSDAVDCPALDLSDTQVRLVAAGESILCLPLPSGTSGCPLSKWSKKKRTLTIQFPRTGEVPVSLSPMSSSMAEQLASQGWGVIDGFLPGPEADELRSHVLQQRALGKLQTGKNSHEGPVRSTQDGSVAKDGPMKNDEYTFCDSEGGDAPPLRELTRRCNQLLAKLMVGQEAGSNLAELRTINLLQGHPMMAVYPGNGSAYGRHLDSTAGGRGANGRVLTLVLYLNPFWRQDHGGCLRILKQLADDGTAGTDVEPLHGRLIAFFCQDQNPHEVLPAWRDRVAVTIWYYDGDRLKERCVGNEAALTGVFEGG